MEKGKEPVIYIIDNETTTHHSEEEVELNNGEMMSAPEEKAKSDAVKLAELKAAKRRQYHRDYKSRAREKKLNYITSLEKEQENLTYFISTATPTINILSHTWERLQFEKQIWSTRLQSLNERYIQSSEEYRRLQQERIDLENLQQEQSRAPNAAQDPNSMLEPWQIQTSGLSHQQAQQSGGLQNAVYHSSGIMVPQQIQTSGPSHQLGGPHNAAHHSYGMLDTNADINGLQEPGMRELGQSSASQKGVSNFDINDFDINNFDINDFDQIITTEEWVELFGINDFDQNIPAPQLSADDSVLGWEMPSTAQLQEDMSSADVEKATSDAVQIE